LTNVQNSTILITNHHIAKELLCAPNYLSYDPLLSNLSKPLPLADKSQHF